MTPSLKAKSLKPHEAYSRIFERIYIPEDDQYLIEWWQLLRSLTPSNFLEVEEQVKHNLIPMLKTEVEFSEDPIICLFLAHWYNFGYLSGVKNYQVIVEQSTLDAIKGLKDQFNDYSDQLNQYNLAISNWYYGLFELL